MGTTDTNGPGPGVLRGLPPDREAARTTVDRALRLRNVSKTFPGVRALSGVDFEVRPGSVHALLGHNGSGKSTLIKCLAGVHTPDEGAKATVFGKPLALGDALEARHRRLRFVHQDLGIVPELGAVDNIGLAAGYERASFGRIAWRRQARRSRELLAQFGFHFDPTTPLSQASPPERAVVAIVRALADWQDSEGVLVLDEPTAALAAHEVDRLFALIREISATGAAVVLVSHRLDEVMAVADHATVLRDGRRVWDGALGDVTMEGLVDVIVGSAEKAADSEPTAGAAPGAGTPEGTGRKTPALEVRDLCGRYLRGLDLRVGAGEIVGIAGLLGSGREEVPYVLAGAHTDGVTGSVAVDGVTVERLSVQGARRLGVVLVPADRGAEGVVEGFTTTENVSLGALRDIRSHGVVAPAAERRFARGWLTSVHADLAYAPRPITTLSGGNQQKAVLARALSVGPKVLVLSEPTAGIDIGARNVIYDELRRRAADGLAIVLASSDTEDLLACCDRVVALRDGRVAGEFSGDRMTKSAIAYAVEGAHDEQH
ncbi:ribose import ATP-binding protein RbsA 2 [Streptomyces sp. e14]|uniref:sugar ABC transporter ATP-binding protein n=1 Tax=Streptomyces sp. e14 TaxID=645465 RepID=UPI0001D06BB9|nr:sugar ABC transporter ATP-binding protein [Streptomyces sp. e14]EFF89096.1 ribose import ATP-binding protein RbsA 2 [Streptomyces sp. e14]